MPDSENEEETSTILKYGNPQFFTMLRAVGPITKEDYETICKEVYVLRTFLSKTHGKNGAARALDRLKDKLQEVDQLVGTYLEDACLAEKEGELALAGAIPTVKEEEKAPVIKFKLPPVDFDVWDGKQEKFFAWMSSVLRLIGLTKMNDSQAQLMVLKKIPEGIQNQCEHLTSFALIKEWLMERHGTDNALLAGVTRILKKVTKTECMVTFIDVVLPKILKIQGLVNNFSS